MEYLSTFAPHIIGLIEQKRALGYKYEGQSAILKRFDMFCLEHHPNEDILNRGLMMDWAAKRPGEHPRNIARTANPCA